MYGNVSRILTKKTCMEVRQLHGNQQNDMYLTESAAHVVLSLHRFVQCSRCHSASHRVLFQPALSRNDVRLPADKLASTFFERMVIFFEKLVSSRLAVIGLTVPMASACSRPSLCASYTRRSPQTNSIGRLSPQRGF